MESHDYPIRHFEQIKELAVGLRSLPAQVLEHQYSYESFGSWSLLFRYKSRIFRIAFERKKQRCVVSRAAELEWRKGLLALQVFELFGGKMSRVTICLLLIITALPISTGHSQGRLIPAGVGKSGEAAPPRASNPSKGPKDFDISVAQQPNPLAEVAAQLSKQFGVAISYEEPAWKSDSDLMRFADTPRVISQSPEARPRINPRLKAPALGSLDVRATIQETQNEFQRIGEILQDAIVEHGRRANPGYFRLEKIGEYAYSIVPTSIRGDAGRTVAASSPLDARISFPVEKRSLGETLSLLSKTISEVTRQRFEVQAFAMGPNNIYSDGTVNIGAQDEVARTVLARALRDISLAPHDAPPLWFNLEYAVNGNLTLPDAEIINPPTYNLRLYSVTRRDSQGREQFLNAPPRENR